MTRGLTGEGLQQLIEAGAAAQGALDGPAAGTSPWPVPEAVVATATDPMWGEALLYLAHPTFGRRVEAPTHATLTEFVNLSAAPVEKIAAFARRWGVLGGACRHGYLLSLHARNAVTLEHQRCGLRTDVVETETLGRQVWVYEPIGEWRALAEDLGALLTRAGLNLRSGDDPEVMAAMNELLQSALIAPRLEAAELNSDGAALQYRMTLQPRTLWSAMVVAAATRAAGFSTSALAVCAGCAVEFTGARRNRLYCDTCRGAGIPEKLRQQRRRARMSGRRAIDSHGRTWGDGC